MDAERIELYRKIKPLVTWDVRTIGVYQHGEWVNTPPVYDIEHPERSLWGMVDWNKISFDLISQNNGRIVMHYGNGWHETACIDIALLKAIIWQMEDKDGR